MAPIGTFVWAHLRLENKSSRFWLQLYEVLLSAKLQACDFVMWRKQNVYEYNKKKKSKKWSLRRTCIAITGRTKTWTYFSPLFSIRKEV